MIHFIQENFINWHLVKGGVSIDLSYAMLVLIGAILFGKVRNSYYSLVGRVRR